MKTSSPKLDMGSITALYLFLTESQQTNIAVKHKIQNDPTWSHLNWDEAMKWNKVIQAETRYSLVSICLQACFVFVTSDPTLSALSGLGRGALTSVLSQDEWQVFKNAKLLDDIPNENAIKWWDYFKSLNRSNNDQLKVKQGRLAERWTMVLEQEYILENCPKKKPKWVALEGDHFGYDIKSYRKKDEDYDQIILIEVKSFSQRSRPIIYITKNEWDKAIKSSPNYVFYIWCMEPATYKILTVDDIMNEIPINKSRGIWELMSLNLETWWQE